MKVGVGYSENPESSVAGLQAIHMAIAQVQLPQPCDLVILFATGRHDYAALREAVSSVIGEKVPIYGGGAVGIITNDYFGYAGDQVGLACFWLDEVTCNVLVERDLNRGEEEAGISLGRRLAELGTSATDPVMLFYETFDFSEGMRMMMATWLLDGIEKGLNGIPNLVGAGLMGNHAPTPNMQWTGDGISLHNAMALAFSGNIHMDSVIMHGCRPATTYYQVTKAAGQAILEINGKPAISFIDELLGGTIAPEQYPFFLLFGVNHGRRWDEYNEDNYASRLCLGIDKENSAIIMFEPDMTEGTEFQLMLRSMEMDYIEPKINKAFADLGDREPVFAVYIDCAGRCAGYGGNDVEDALAIQAAVAGRVPLLGIYGGVEIASMGGRPRGLDWTGVFCLFSQGKDGIDNREVKMIPQPLWEAGSSASEPEEISIEALVRLSQESAARYLALDTNSFAIRYELEQKRRGFSLLSELSYSLRQSPSHENLFPPTTRRINATLNMQRTMVLTHDEQGRFTPQVLQGYSIEERTLLAGKQITIPPELLSPDYPVVVTGADPENRFRDLREVLGIPYFISYPIRIQGDVYGILLTGRLVEAEPYLLRLSRSDVETVQAIATLLASVLVEQRIQSLEERNRIMVDTAPICCVFWDEVGNPTDCNHEALTLFGLSTKDEFINQFHSLSPERQPDGSPSMQAALELIRKAFVNGEAHFRWMHLAPDGGPMPVEVTLIRVPKGENYIVAGYLLDLRDHEAAKARLEETRDLTERLIKAKNEFIASVSHEIRTPLNAILAMARTASEVDGISESQQTIISLGMQSVMMLTSAIEAILDFSKLDSGQLLLETGEFAIRDLLEGIIGIAKGEAIAKSISLNLSVEESVPSLLIGDSTRLGQVVFNIVMNAVKFTEEGGVRIGVSWADNSILSIVVHDTGIGISKEQMEHIFRPLHAGDSSYTRKYSGLGMGLAVSNSLTSLMGGELSCESEPGRGSIFTIRVPLEMPATHHEDDERVIVSTDLGRLKGLRVLVAEDNNINQMIIEELLSNAGIGVTLVDNGLRAIERLHQESFDIILMDVQMPEMDGLMATTQIRTDPRYADLPILAMTANVGKDHVAESIEAGMNDHLSKPVDTEQLYAALLKWSKR